MAEPLIYLTTVDQLTGDLRVHPEVSAAMEKDLPVAKLGGIFIDLPRFQEIPVLPLKRTLRKPLATEPWFFLFHTYKPAALGLAFAEMAHTDLQYHNQTWPLSFVAGYFSHLALDRVLNSLSQKFLRENLNGHLDPLTLQFQCERFQSLFFHREFFGEDIFGTQKGYDICDISLDKSPLQDEVFQGFCVKGCLKALGQAPSPKEMKKWRRGFVRFAKVQNAQFQNEKKAMFGDNLQKIVHNCYRNDFFDFVDFYSQGLELAVEYINTIYDYIRTGDFSPQARTELLEVIPEIDLNHPPEEDFGLPILQADLASSLFENSQPPLAGAQEVFKKEIPSKKPRTILPFISPRSPSPKNPA